MTDKPITDEDVSNEENNQFSKATLESNPRNWLYYRRSHDLFYDVEDEEIEKIVTALLEYPKLKEKSNQIDYLIDYFMCDNYDQLLELLKSNSHRLTDLLVQNQELKESYQERVSTANKIISEKIDEIKKLKTENEGYQYVIRYDNEQYALLRQEIKQLKQLKQRLDERIKELENSPDYETGYALEELQNLLKPKEEE